MERHFAATCPGFAAPPPLLVPNLAALPHATWPWPAERHSSTAAQPPSGQGQPADRHRAYTPREYQPAAAWLSQQPANRGSMQPPHERQPAAAAAGAMHEPDGRSASLADKTTQWPECVDRQTQTEPPEPDTLPASRCKKSQHHVILLYSLPHGACILRWVGTVAQLLHIAQFGLSTALINRVNVSVMRRHLTVQGPPAIPTTPPQQSGQGAFGVRHGGNSTGGGGARSISGRHSRQNASITAGGHERHRAGPERPWNIMWQR